jgi:hypothetical protein
MAAQATGAMTARTKALTFQGSVAEAFAPVSADQIPYIFVFALYLGPVSYFQFGRKQDEVVPVLQRGAGLVDIAVLVPQAVPSRAAPLLAAAWVVSLLDVPAFADLQAA